MMGLVRKRGEALAEERAARAKEEIRATLAAELPGDVRISETGEGVELAARGLKVRLLANSSLRDIGFLVRAVR